ncbi:hypothetical protein QE152_g30028 [Popillia japonica]|uniref:Uncharacterized protein n=1 Tax=Popillia japonica TaxID=7064 RepID=A0AAW1JFY7_POPJA
MDSITEIVPVKSEECIIDLEATQESEDTIERWHEQISKRINVSTQRDNEKLVDDMMLSYNSILKDKTVRNKDKPLLKTKILLHIRHFYLYYKTLGDAVVDTNYFTRMEDILTYYCNLEMELVYTLSKQRENKKYNLFVIKRLCKVLGIYLHHRLRHIIHVLLKMKYNMRNPTCQMVMRRVYCHFLMTMPSESLSDEVFCRYYLIFERYKQIAKPDEKQMLEEFVFKKFGKTKNFLRRNPIMMTVLSPSCDSVPDALTRLLDYRASAIQAYFVYLKNQVEEAGKSVTDFEAGCGPSEFLSTFNEIPAQTENLTIDSDSDIEELEEDSTIVLSEGEEMEITYKIKNPKKIGTKKIDVIDLISDDDSQPIPDDFG